MARAIRVSTWIAGWKQDRDDPLRRRQPPHQRRILARDEDEAAEQARHDIVPGRRIGRDPLALEREGKQFLEVENGSSSRALAAAAPATAEAAEPPMPADIGTPLSIDKPGPERRPGGVEHGGGGGERGVGRRLGREGVDTSPDTPPSRTPGSSSRIADTRSRAASNAWPRMSKPTPTLPMLAGALADAVPCRSCLGGQLDDSGSRSRGRAAEQRALHVHHVREHRCRRRPPARPLPCTSVHPAGGGR